VLVHVDTEQAHDQLVNSRLAYVSSRWSRNGRPCAMMHGADAPFLPAAYTNKIDAVLGLGNPVRGTSLKN
jgi:hypothetical protein